MIPSYEEFLLIENFVNDSNFSLLTEKNLSSKIDNNIKFGIILPTYKIKKDGSVHTSRADHMASIDVLKDSIGSIKNQKYGNWKLYVIGDAYEDDQEVKDLLSSMLKSDQYKYHNLSKPGERDSNISSEEKRLTGGIAAMNKGIDMCNADGIEYITRLDHDDKWKPNHLELLAKAYTQYPDLGFVFTQSRKKVDSTNSSKQYMMMPDGKVDTDVNNKGYVSGNTGHSAVSWCPKIVGKFKYRNAADQKNTAPRNKTTIAGDIDMFKRIMDKIKNAGHKYMYIPQMTNYVRNRKGKF
jgi:glycosyltransferase involved in cell wall biosynthesis